MPLDSSILLVDCQMALGLDQQEYAAFLGVDRRSIQRWQDKGFSPLPEMAQKLADAVRPTRPDLADRVIELGAKSAALTGAVPPYSPASAEAIADIVQAAATAAGLSAEAVRPAIAAAFTRAHETGVDVRAVIAGLKSET
jgi:hypothetical protein